MFFKQRYIPKPSTNTQKASNIIQSNLNNRLMKSRLQAFNPNPKFPLHFNPDMDEATEISEHGLSW